MKEGDDGMLEDVLQDEARHEEQADGVSIDGNIDDLQGMAAYCTARSVLDETNNGKRGWHDAETCQGGWWTQQNDSSLDKLVEAVEILQEARSYGASGSGVHGDGGVDPGLLRCGYLYREK
jgi:hypothetical protein